MMQKGSVMVALVLASLMVGLLFVQFGGHASAGLFAPAPGQFVRSAPGSSATHFSTASATPSISFPRTVLVETFTGEWCYYCIAESQGFYILEHSWNGPSFTIGELHVCGGSPCGDGYPTADGTSNLRQAYYSVPGYPTVFFDGGWEQIGAGGSPAQMAAQYEAQIRNASSVPGNVSIAESVTVSASTTLTAFGNITSGITGTYRAMTYVMEYINKNDSSAHDMAWVVRSTLLNQSVVLTAGSTLPFQASGTIGATWNPLRLGIVTFVQQVSTKIVENTNFARVGTMKTAFTTAPTTVTSGKSSMISLSVKNSSTNAPLALASVYLTSDGGGSFNPSYGITGSDGSFNTTFTAPTVTASETILITAQVTSPGYVTGTPATASVVVNPNLAPSLPTGLALTPGNQQVTLTWTAPTTGTGGVTYHIYRSSSPTGTFAEVGTATSLSYVDTSLVSGQSYWYTLNAQNVGGFSANVSAIAAIGVVGTPQGLPSSVGWWLSIDSVRVTSGSNGLLSLNLPNGNYPYELGPTSNVYLAPVPLGNLIVANAVVHFTAAFQPNYASLEGTVSPWTATVTLDGAAIAVVDGSFTAAKIAGTYSLVISSPGYVTHTSSVTLTPGNATVLPMVTLHPVSTPSGGSGAGGWMSSPLMMGALVGAALAIGLGAVVGGLRLSKNRKAKVAESPAESEMSEPPT
jgi:hypothetical protein